MGANLEGDRCARGDRDVMAGLTVVIDAREGAVGDVFDDGGGGDGRVRGLCGDGGPCADGGQCGDGRACRGAWDAEVDRAEADDGVEEANVGGARSRDRGGVGVGREGEGVRGSAADEAVREDGVSMGSFERRGVASEGRGHGDRRACGANMNGVLTGGYLDGTHDGAVRDGGGDRRGKIVEVQVNGSGGAIGRCVNHTDCSWARRRDCLAGRWIRGASDCGRGGSVFFGEARPSGAVELCRGVGDRWVEASGSAARAQDEREGEEAAAIEVA